MELCCHVEGVIFFFFTVVENMRLEQLCRRRNGENMWIFNVGLFLLLSYVTNRSEMSCRYVWCHVVIRPM